MIYNNIYLFTKIKLLLHLIVICLLSLFVSGCGIYSFSGASIPDAAETISVSYIENEAELIQPNLSNNVTESLITKCLTETNLTPKEKDADIKFSGTIKKYTLEPISIQNNETAAQNRLTISLEITYINTLDGSQNFNKVFTHYADFNSNENFSEIEESLNNTIIINLIDDIFNDALVNW